jgi:ribose 5-phosphate isomerase A
VVDRSKVVERLGVRFPLPVEVVPFARADVARRIRAGRRVDAAHARRREARSPTTATTILDCRFPGGIADAAALERQLDEIPGVVESGCSSAWPRARDRRRRRAASSAASAGRR